MPIREYEDHILSENEIIVSKNDYTQKRIFTDKDEADAYYDYLRKEEMQEEAARAQLTTVEQNKQIIENQKRLIEVQEYNRRMPQRPPFPQPSRQVLDPEYREWLQFKKETDPEYLRWKRNKAAEEERRKQEEAARVAKLESERLERERERQKQLQLEKERKDRELQEEIRLIEEDLINGKPVIDKVKVATHTKNQQVIYIFKNQKSLSKDVLSALSCNPSVSAADVSLFQNRLTKIREDEQRKIQEDIERKEAEAEALEAETKETIEIALKWFFSIFLIIVMIWAILYYLQVNI